MLLLAQVLGGISAAVFTTGIIIGAADSEQRHTTATFHTLMAGLALFAVAVTIGLGLK